MVAVSLATFVFLVTFGLFYFVSLMRNEAIADQVAQLMAQNSNVPTMEDTQPPFEYYKQQQQPQQPTQQEEGSWTRYQRQHPQQQTQQEDGPWTRYQAGSVALGEQPQAQQYMTNEEFTPLTGSRMPGAQQTPVPESIPYTFNQLGVDSGYALALTAFVFYPLLNKNKRNKNFFYPKVVIHKVC